MPVGLENIFLPSDDTKKRAYELAAMPPAKEEGKRKWRRGEMEFEALMRHLDNAVRITQIHHVKVDIRPNIPL